MTWPNLSQSKKNALFWLFLSYLSLIMTKQLLELLVANCANSANASLSGLWLPWTIMALLSSNSDRLLSSAKTACHDLALVISMREIAILCCRQLGDIFSISHCDSNSSSPCISHRPVAGSWLFLRCWKAFKKLYCISVLSIRYQLG